MPDTISTEISSLFEYKKAAVDRFDLAAAHETYARIHFDDVNTHGSPGREALVKIWDDYNKDRHERLEKYPHFASQVANQTIDDFRAEVYP